MKGRESLVHADLPVARSLNDTKRPKQLANMCPTQTNLYLYNLILPTVSNPTDDELKLFLDEYATAKVRAYVQLKLLTGLAKQNLLTIRLADIQAEACMHTARKPKANQASQKFTRGTPPENWRRQLKPSKRYTPKAMLARCIFFIHLKEKGTTQPTPTVRPLANLTVGILFGNAAFLGLARLVMRDLRTTI